MKPERTENNLDAVTKSQNKDMLVGALAVILMIVGMVASIYYPFGNGKPMTVSDFIQLWLREIIFIGFLAVVLVILGVRWALQRLRPPEKGKHNAP